MTSIEHADSIIEESVISTSPYRHIDTDNDTSNTVDILGPPPNRRVTKVYGKPKIDVDKEDDRKHSYENRAHTLRTAPPDTEKLVIPESEDASTYLTGYAGSRWREQLKEIDVHYEKDSNRAPAKSANLSQETSDESQKTGSYNTGLFDGTLSSLSYDDLCSPPEQSTSDNVENGILFDGSLTSLLSEDSHSLPEHLTGDNIESGSLFDGTLTSLLSGDPRSPLEQSDTENIEDRSLSISGHVDEDANIPLDDAPRKQLSFRDAALRMSSSSDANEGHEKIEEVDGENPKSRQKRKGKQRLRKASKKELKEIQKESARLLAERTVEIKRPEQRPTRTVRDLFGKLILSPRNAVAGGSDPILSFSSPDGSKLLQSSGNSIEAKGSSPVALHHSTPRKKQPERSNIESESQQGSDVELPTAESILERDITKRAEKLLEEARMKELRERKLRALKSKTTSTTSSDDDLEVEKLVTPRFRKSYKTSSAYQSKLMHKRDGEEKQISKINLEYAAKPLFNADTRKKAKAGYQGAMSHQSLNDILLQRAEKQSIEIEEKKKEKWVQHGGSLKVQKPSGERSVASWLQKGLAQDVSNPDTFSEEEEAQNMETDIDNEGDSGMDYADERREKRDGESAVEKLEEMAPEAAPDNGDDSDEEDEDKENQRPVSRRPRLPIVVDSDDENDPRLEIPKEPVVLVRDSSRLGDTDFHDVYDGASEGSIYGDENKENMVGDRNVDNDLVFPTCELSMIRPNWRKPLGALEEDPSQAMEVPPRIASHGRILRVLHEEDKENTLKSVHSSPSDQVVELSFSTSTENFEGSTLVSPASFSQFVKAAEKPTVDEPSPTPLLAGGFSQFFSPSRNNAKQTLTETKFDHPPLLTKGGEFEFTQPNALLPSVHISESQRREVDDMFNKDQDFKLGEAKRAKIEAQISKPRGPKAPYFGSFIASPQPDISPMIRQPLATMSLVSIEDTEETTTTPEECSPQFKSSRFRRERLQSRSESPSPSAAPGIRNAFEVLKNASVHEHKKVITKALRSEFIEGEAQESDDDVYAGFGGMNKPEDDEEENDDQDAILEGLVDDTTLDDNTVAKDLVLEKHKEFEEQHDAALLKYHQDAAEGKMRIKRKNGGLGFDDSESEDEDRYRPRKQFPKKRRIEGDTLDACAQNPETRAFFDAYQQPLIEGEDELHLASVKEPLEKETEDVMSEGESGEEEVVEISKLREELRERILEDEDDLENETVRPDFADVTWVDNDELQTADDVDVHIEQGMLEGRSSIPDTSLTALRFSGNFVTNGTLNLEKTRLKAWANEEAQSRSAGGRGGFSRREEKEKGRGARKSGHQHSLSNTLAENERRSGGPTAPTNSLITSVQKHKSHQPVTVIRLGSSRPNRDKDHLCSVEQEDIWSQMDVDKTLGSAVEVLKDQVCTREHCYYAFDALYCSLTGAVPLSPKFPEAKYPLFVTWNIRSSKPGGNPRLRGCIGCFEPLGLYEGLAEYALISALRDTRFRSIEERELARLECVISLLTDFEDASSYLDWTIGVHGIYITFPHPSTLLLSSPSSSTPSPLSSSTSLPTTGFRFGKHKRLLTATYLPEVAAEQGWSKVEAIDSAIRKAGWDGPISEDLRRHVTIRRYQSRKFTAGWDEYYAWRTANTEVAVTVAA